MTDDHGYGPVAVLGAGVMGTGIAVLLLGHGIPVLLVDPDTERLGRAGTDVDRQLRLAQLMGSAGERHGELRITTTVDHAADSAVVIEAVTENVEVKAKTLADVAAVVRFGTPIVTNTSSIPVDELADALPRPAELVGVHFMNPPYLIGAVEVVRGARTGERTMREVCVLLDQLGLRAVLVGDAPGFVTSRVLHPMINGAARIVQFGVAEPEVVDTLMQDCLGHRTGPLRTADLIGLDNLVDSLRVLHERTGDEACRPCELLLAKVRVGELGRKSGRGFYSYEEATR